MDYYINGHIVRINQGDGAFVNSQRLHYGFSNEHNECTFIALVLSPDIFTSITSAAKEYMNHKFGLKNTDYICLYRHVPWQKDILETILTIHNDMINTVMRPLRFISLAIDLIDQIGEHIDDYQENEFDSHDQDVFLDMTDYISKHYDQIITIESLSKHVGISRNKCFELFKHFTKNTFSYYLTHYRLNKSMCYLKNTHLSILEISQLCGFSSSSYFTTVFKKENGYSPKQARMKLFKKSE